MAERKAVIVVESPAKTRTIRQFLGEEFEVVATMGHVRDLPEREFGVDVKNGFEPKFRIIPSKEGAIKRLEEAVKEAEEVYLASDPDREGEAIAWHVIEVLGLKRPLRIEFTEITKRAVEEALKNPRGIDMNRVDAQIARRILDRIVGYKLSPLLWRKVKGVGALSAGRVQSVALRLVCEREKEIEEFVPREYWTIKAVLKTPRGEEFEAELAKVEGEKPEIPHKEEADKLASELRGQKFIVKEVKKREERRNPPPPFITSTMQQEASKRLRFTPSRTMLVAQQLYEGLEVGPEGHVGLITYMRTDSVRVAPEAQKEAREFLTEEIGREYIPPEPPVYKSKRTAQEAHECIRPTSVRRTPEDVAKFVNQDQARLYELIWRRFLASQCSPAQVEVTSATIEAGRFALRAAGQVLIFEGFLRLWKPEEERRDRPLPEIHQGEELTLVRVVPEQHFTQPPPRYTEATLIKVLEEKGVGRPSTYAPTMMILLDRRYVVRDEKRRLRPTELGLAVNELLVRNFPDIVDVSFTAWMEEQLDEIERGKAKRPELLGRFYPEFMRQLKEAKGKIERVRMREDEETGEQCPECGSPLVVKEGKFGRFVACSSFPRCKFKKPFSIGERCSKCGSEVVERWSRRRRKPFYACSNPDCDFLSWEPSLSPKEPPGSAEG